MKIIGLTGGMGMGKSTLTKWLISQGIPVYDADARVHYLYAHNKELIQRISAMVPNCVIDGIIDRKVLGAWLMSKHINLTRLGVIVGPYLDQDRRDWILDKRLHGCKLVVADVPILFEHTKINEWDEIICVDVLPIWQRQRIMKRPGSSIKKMYYLLGHQWSNARRKIHSDHIIHTGLSQYGTLAELRKLFS